MLKKMKFTIKDFFRKCDQLRSFQHIWSQLLNKSLMENFIFVQCMLLCNFSLKNNTAIYSSQEISRIATLPLCIIISFTTKRIDFVEFQTQMQGTPNG